MKRLIIAALVIAALGISTTTNAQLRIGAVANARVSSAASVNTPAVTNALRTSSSAAVHTSNIATVKASQTTEAATDKAVHASTVAVHDGEATAKNPSGLNAAAANSTNASLTTKPVRAGAAVSSSSNVSVH